VLIGFMNITSGDRFDENHVLVTARMVRDHWYPNRTRYAPDWALVPAIHDLMRSYPDASPEKLSEIFIAQSKFKYRKNLSAYVAGSITADLNVKGEDINIFTGWREFAFRKAAAMVCFFASRDERLSKTKLNHLLFYSDFTNYYLYDRSISGSRYVRRRTAPAFHNYESFLKALLFSGAVRIENRTGESIIVNKRDPDLTIFSLLEVITLYRVDASFGSMTTSEIAEYLGQESLYRFSAQDNFIPYEYARLLSEPPETIGF
jgi:hypothetical protein